MPERYGENQTVTDRVRFFTDRIKSRLDDVFYERGMQRLKQLVEDASASEESAPYRSELDTMGPSPTPLRRPAMSLGSGAVPSLAQPPSLQSPPGPAPPPAAPSPPPPRPLRMPKDLKSQFPAHEWNALVKRNPQVKYAATQQELIDALDAGKMVDAIQAGQRIGLDGDKMLAVISEHGARKAVDKLGPQIESAEDQETAHKILRRGLAGLSLSQQRTAELALQPMIATKKTRAVLNLERLGEHQAAFLEQHDGLDSDQLGVAWRKYIRTVEPGVRAEFSKWAASMVKDARANEIADRAARRSSKTETSADERLYNSIASEVRQNVATETNKKFPTGTSIAFVNGEATFSSGGDPAAAEYYTRRRREEMQKRLKVAGLWNKYKAVVGEEEAAAAVTLPPKALEAIKSAAGKPVKFRNGQTWKWENDKPVRVP